MPTYDGNVGGINHLETMWRSAQFKARHRTYQPLCRCSGNARSKGRLCQRGTVPYHLKQKKHVKIPFWASLGAVCLVHQTSSFRWNKFWTMAKRDRVSQSLWIWFKSSCRKMEVCQFPGGGGILVMSADSVWLMADKPTCKPPSPSADQRNQTFFPAHANDTVRHWHQNFWSKKAFSDDFWSHDNCNLDIGFGQAPPKPI